MYSTGHLLLILLFPLTLATPVPTRSPSPPPATAKTTQAQSPISPSTVSIIKPNSNQHLKYTLGSVIAPTGPNSITWSLSDDKSFIAKQFRTHSPDEAVASQQRKAFGFESMYSTRFLGEALVTGGESKIGQGDDTFAFLVTPSLNGRDFRTQSKGLLDGNVTGRKACKDFLREVVRPEVKRYVKVFHDINKLVHLDPSQSNTIWAPGGREILGFLNFDPGQIDKVDGPLYNKAAEKLWGPSIRTKVTVEMLADAWADRMYPDSMCPKSTYNVVVATAGRRRREGIARSSQRFPY